MRDWGREVRRGRVYVLDANAAVESTMRSLFSEYATADEGQATVLAIPRDTRDSTERCAQTPCAAIVVEPVDVDAEWTLFVRAPTTRAGLARRSFDHTHVARKAAPKGRRWTPPSARRVTGHDRTVWRAISSRWSGYRRHNATTETALFASATTAPSATSLAPTPVSDPPTLSSEGPAGSSVLDEHSSASG